MTLISTANKTLLSNGNCHIRDPITEMGVAHIVRHDLVAFKMTFLTTILTVFWSIFWFQLLFNFKFWWLLLYYYSSDIFWKIFVKFLYDFLYIQFLRMVFWGTFVFQLYFNSASILLWGWDQIAIITRGLYTFFSHFLKSKTVFSWGFFLKILALCMVSIQKRLLVKSEL